MTRPGETGALRLPLIGRSEELAVIHGVVAAARNGSGGALFVEGDPGIGKTALIDAAIDDLAAVRVLRITGIEVESTIPYAALQRLGASLAPLASGIAGAQRDALRVAVGLSEGEPPERALVGLGALSLLAQAGDELPTLCVVDDAQHLDAESLEVLGFVARRLSAERVAFLFAAREDPAVTRFLAGVPRLELSGLDRTSAVALLGESIEGFLDPTIAAEFVAFTGGNPLALRELGVEWSAERLVAAVIANVPVPIGRTLEAHYERRVSALPDRTQLWLLVAAAESAGDLQVIRSVAAVLGLHSADSSPAEAAQLVGVRDTVRFRHPLIRSAVYGRASDADRRRVHQALHAETAARGQREVAAWHAAAAAEGVSEEVARELAAVAELAGARGGLESRARLLARAADLAPTPTDRSAWLLAASEAAISGGTALLARQLVGRIDSDALDPVGRGRVLLIGAMCALFLSDPLQLRHSVADLLSAADAFRGIVPALEQRALLLAATFIATTEDASVGVTLPQLGRRLREGAESLESPYAIALRATSALILDDYAAAAPRLRDAVAMLDGLDDRALLDFSFYAVSPCIALWDADAASRLLSRTVDVGRARGALREVDAALWVLSAVELSRMNPRLAGEYIARADELRRALGYGDEQAVNAALLAWQGIPRATVDQIARGIGDAGFGGVARMAREALAVNEIGDGDYRAAFGRLTAPAEQSFLQAGFPQLVDLIEAAARSGNRARVRDAFAQLRVFAEVSGSRWARGMYSRCEALMAEDADAEVEVHYAASIELLDTPGHRGDCGRSRLLYGEWLRRIRRRSDARVQLQAALDAFEAVEAGAFAARARRELKAAGAEPTTSSTRWSALTPQEREIARLASGGATNSEIAGMLFISSNTVDYHLRKVFRKLEVTSRRQLAERLSQD